MDYLQYYAQPNKCIDEKGFGFKPCYKWITFNIEADTEKIRETLIKF